MSYVLRYLAGTASTFAKLRKKDPTKHAKTVNCLRRLAKDPKHPGLNSHKYASLKGPHGEDIWESYVENNTPAAWRVFWVYGPDERDEQNLDAPLVKVITVIAITPHP